MFITQIRFSNFRILRDIELSLSQNAGSHLSVIRAENDSGKTTLATAIQWVLYGDKALPGGGSNYRLSPIDWEASQKQDVHIEGSIELVHSFHKPTQDGDYIENEVTYRIMRNTTETLEQDKWDRKPSTLSIFELTSSGAEPVDTPERILDQILPERLQDLFFIDGDRALSYIEAESGGTSAKRKKVQNAIKTLLGLEVLENAIDHVRKTASGVNKEAKQDEADQQLSDVTTRLEEAKAEYESQEGELDRANEELGNLDASIDDLDKDIEAVLRQGDEEALRESLNENKHRIQKLEEREKKLEDKHSELFKSPHLARELLKEHISKSYRILDELKVDGQIPSEAIPVLRERLELRSCICGESLEEDSEDGQKRRQYLEKMLAQQTEEEDVYKQLTDLYYRIPNLQPIYASDKAEWIKQYEDIFSERADVTEEFEEARKNKRQLEVQLDSLSHTDIKELREQRRKLENRKRTVLQNQASAEAKLKSLTDDIKEYETKRDKLLRKQKKYEKLISKLNSVSDIKRVLERTHQTVLDEELDKVSNTMNDLFLKMIGSDPEQGAIIQEASITKDFDITVYGPDNRTLNPDEELNGASRRALTISFILALTRVSEVEAPNIIDTPLGMMSGHVKRSVLKTTIENSSQLVLFLTRSEIEGCQDIIDHYAGEICTLTNPAHYPTMLRNEPNVKNKKIIKCKCNHREYCDVCERNGDSDNEKLTYVT